MPLSQAQESIISQALILLEETFQREELHATNPDHVASFCQLKLARLEHEVFAVLFLDNQHRLISFVEMFRGTINAASVYPREVAKTALQLNAAAVVLTHNHPSGIAEPSEADKRVTQDLRDALKLLDIRVLDHIVVGVSSTVSFAKRGLL